MYRSWRSLRGVSFPSLAIFCSFLSEMYSHVRCARLLLFCFLCVMSQLRELSAVGGPTLIDPIFSSIHFETRWVCDKSVACFQNRERQHCLYRHIRN